jgi:bla regulator protein blaR1
MIASYLSVLWAAYAPGLGNHIWQSTLFAAAGGLLTLILRNNHARARYWLWLAASMKFLIPFSLLAGMGSELAWPGGAARTDSGIYFAMEELSQPFTHRGTAVISRASPPTALPSLVHLLPTLLAGVWLGGFLVVLFVWYARWRRVSAAIGGAAPLREGREVEALRRVELARGIRKRIEMFVSRTPLEPGIFGIAKPVLIWPGGISERLEDAHLEAILAHEVWHVRRQDNLAAAMHMVVEAVFWFHPMVWWLGARLVEERERACDEEVLASGCERQVYAESILKICEYCVESPLACVAGVTGADLKKRIVQIMTKRVARKLDFSRRLLLGASGVAAVALPIVFGLTGPTQSRAESQAQNAAGTGLVFEAASIKPNTTGEPMAGFTVKGRPMQAIAFRPDRFMATNFTLHGLIRVAYGVQDSQIIGGPDWLESEKYDVEAKLGASVTEELGKLSADQGNLERLSMIQGLLADRFKLALHRETREVPVYELVAAGEGPQLHAATPGDTYANGVKSVGGRPTGGGGISQPAKGQLVGQGVRIASLVRELSRELGGRIVVDKTGLTGNYDFTLQWKPDESHASIFSAIQEQLGLKLESQKEPVEVLVIDRAEKPSEK